MRRTATMIMTLIAVGCQTPPPSSEAAQVTDIASVMGSYVVALPMKIEGGSGGPLRIVAWVP